MLIRGNVTVDLELLANTVTNVFLFITHLRWKDVKSVTAIQLVQHLLSVMTEGSVHARTTSKDEDVNDAVKTNRISRLDVSTVLSVTTSFKML